jgi:hypothetical protein
MYSTLLQHLIKAVVTLFLLSCTAACQSESKGPGMILSFGSVIDGRSIAIKSAKLPDGQAFGDPGAVGGQFDKTRETWRLGGIGATMAASGDYRGLPEWVDFEWQEPSYPGLEPADFPTPEAFNLAVDEKYAKLPIKTQRLAIKSRIPQEVVDEVIESKRNAPKGKSAEKTLWLYIFWTPDGMKMRWEVKYNKGRMHDGFGKVIQEGGDDLDRYNQ